MANEETKTQTQKSSPKEVVAPVEETTAPVDEVVAPVDEVVAPVEEVATIETQLPTVPPAPESAPEFLAKFNEMAAEIERLNKLVVGTADKNRLNRFLQKESDSGEGLPREYRLNVYGGKVVVAWGPLKVNDVYRDSNNMWREVQVTELFYADENGLPLPVGESVDYRLWQSQRSQIDVFLVEERLLPRGERLLVVEAKETGKQYTVKSTFVN